jgi:hypothetical protein
LRSRVHGERRPQCPVVVSSIRSWYKALPVIRSGIRALPLYPLRNLTDCPWQSRGWQKRGTAVLAATRPKRAPTQSASGRYAFDAAFEITANPANIVERAAFSDA